MEILKKSKIKEYRDKEKENNEFICPIINCPLDGNRATSSVLDHNHDIPKARCSNCQCGRVRGCISQAANTWLGRVENSWHKYAERHTELSISECLRAAADYLDGDYSGNPLHAAELDMWRRRLKRWKVSTLQNKLKSKGIKTTGLLKKDLIKLYIDHFVIPSYEE